MNARAVTAMVLLGAAAPAVRAEAALPLWELGLGAGVLALPHYRGSDQTHVWLLPVPYAVYRGDWFKADREGARAVLFDTDAVELDLSATASAPTRSEHNDARRGMADLRPTVELGPNLDWTWARGPGWQLQGRLPVRAALTVSSDPRWIGWTASPHANLDLKGLAGWDLGLQAGPVYGSRKFHDTYYTVRADEALPDRPAYAARAGYGGLVFTAALSRRDGDRWFGAYVRHDRLGGATFEDSPLVRRRQSWSAGLGVSWILMTSSRPGAAQEQP